jgi:hypothetical protein
MYLSDDRSHHLFVVFVTLREVSQNIAALHLFQDEDQELTHIVSLEKRGMKFFNQNPLKRNETESTCWS